MIVVSRGGKDERTNFMSFLGTNLAQGQHSDAMVATGNTFWAGAVGPDTSVGVHALLHISWPSAPGLMREEPGIAVHKDLAGGWSGCRGAVSRGISRSAKAEFHWWLPRGL